MPSVPLHGFVQAVFTGDLDVLFMPFELCNNSSIDVVQLEQCASYLSLSSVRFPLNRTGKKLKIIK
jgi:hypothetical protein